MQKCHFSLCYQSCKEIENLLIAGREISIVGKKMFDPSFMPLAISSLQY